jgi:hypothetical protein
VYRHSPHRPVRRATKSSVFLRLPAFDVFRDHVLSVDRHGTRHPRRPVQGRRLGRAAFDRMCLRNLDRRVCMEREPSRQAQHSARVRWCSVPMGHL